VRTTNPQKKRGGGNKQKKRYNFNGRNWGKEKDRERQLIIKKLIKKIKK